MSAKSVVKGMTVKIMGRQRKVLAVYPVRGARWMLVKVNGEFRKVIYRNDHKFA